MTLIILTSTIPTIRHITHPGVEIERALAFHPGLRDLLSELYQYHPDTYRHALCVAAMLQGLSRADPTLTRAGLCHDIGKLQIPVQILVKPDTLTPEERRLMGNHAASSAQLIRRIDPWAADIVVAHHEIQILSHPHRPLRQSDLSNPPTISSSRIALALADQVDALLSRRGYKPPLPPDLVQQHLQTQFEPWVNAEFIAMTIDIRRGPGRSTY